MKMSLLASLCGCVVICSSFTTYAACVQPPSCEELGFTADASKCEGSFLKCPWDLSKAACEETAIPPLPILYGDGTVSKDIISGKTPIGVVFDEEKRLAIALTDVKKDGSPGSEAMKWSENYYDIPNLSSCTDLTSIAKCPFGTDGRENTDEILACGSECGGTPAATAVNRYQPINCSQDFCKKTKWFLPSGQELLKIYDAKDRLEASLTSLSSFGAKILNGWYWSSSERDDNSAWYLTMLSGVTVTGYVLTYNDKAMLLEIFVRPVIAF